MAAVDYIRDDAEKLGLWVRGYDSSPDSGWYLVDLNEIVVHIFVGEERQRYNLDSMYSN
jgi:ribosome-associated protein